MLNTAAKQRADKLEKMARAAMMQYNMDLAKGSEPLFPDWAMDLLGLLADYEKIVGAMDQQRLEVVRVIDFTNGKRSLSVVQNLRVAS